MRAAVSTSLVLSPFDTSEAIFDPFRPNATPLPTLRKRPRLESNDLDAARQEAELKEIEQFEVMRLHSIADEEAW